MIHITVKSTHSILCACGDVHGGSVYSTHGHLGGGGGGEEEEKDRTSKYFLSDVNTTISIKCIWGRGHRGTCFACGGFNTQVFRLWSKLMLSVFKEMLGLWFEFSPGWLWLKITLWWLFGELHKLNLVISIQFPHPKHKKLPQIALTGNLPLSVHSSLHFSKQTASYISPRGVPFRESLYCCAQFVAKQYTAGLSIWRLSGELHSHNLKINSGTC